MLARGPHHSNFCVKAGLHRTAEVFESEWYELKASGRLGGLDTSMPDVYSRNGVSSHRRGYRAVVCADDWLSPACPCLRATGVLQTGAPPQELEEELASLRQ